VTEALLTDATPLVLGSGSPRRREILTSLRVPHVVLAGQADEAVHDAEPAPAYLARVTRAKLDAVARALPAELRARARAILVADTSVIVDGAILGKPADAHEAAQMIGLLAGRAHEVMTRFAIARVSAAGSANASVVPDHEETVTTRVTFRALTPREIRAYAESGEGLDKAGGYAVQGLGAALVPKLEGSYTNVVGLPACEVFLALGKLGLLPT
jgi:septum formation protein